MKAKSERLILIEGFDKWLSTDPLKRIAGIQCANIAEDYAEKKVLESRRELLIDFHKWQQKMWINPNSEITENIVDVFIKSNQ